MRTRWKTRRALAEEFATESAREGLVTGGERGWEGPFCLRPEGHDQRVRCPEQPQNFTDRNVLQRIVLTVMLPAAAGEIGAHEPKRGNTHPVERELIGKRIDLRKRFHVKPARCEPEPGVARERGVTRY